MIYTIIHECILCIHMCYPGTAGRKRSVCSFSRRGSVNGEKGMYAANALRYTNERTGAGAR